MPSNGCDTLASMMGTAIVTTYLCVIGCMVAGIGTAGCIFVN
jgi:hypothetical protein